MNFHINVTQFYINFSRKEHLIELSLITIKNLRDLLSSYTPFKFSFIVPLSNIKILFGIEHILKTDAYSFNFTWSSDKLGKIQILTEKQSLSDISIQQRRLSISIFDFKQRWIHMIHGNKEILFEFTCNLVIWNKA